jgi:hypothetical protein
VSEVRIRGSGSKPKRHGSATLVFILGILAFMNSEQPNLRRNGTLTQNLPRMLLNFLIGVPFKNFLFYDTILFYKKKVLIISWKKREEAGKFLPCSCRISIADPQNVNADPDPTSHFDQDPDPTLHFKPDPDSTLHFDADPDPTFHF